MDRGPLSWKQGCTRAGALHTACGLPHSRIGSDPKDWYKYSKQVNTIYSEILLSLSICAYDGQCPSVLVGSKC